MPSAGVCGWTAGHASAEAVPRGRRRERQQVPDARRGASRPPLPAVRAALEPRRRPARAFARTRPIGRQDRAGDAARPSIPMCRDFSRGRSPSTSRCRAAGSARHVAVARRRRRWRWRSRCGPLRARVVCRRRAHQRDRPADGAWRRHAKCCAWCSATASSSPRIGLAVGIPVALAADRACSARCSTASARPIRWSSSPRLLTLCGGDRRLLRAGAASDATGSASGSPK